jgi:WhiB family redox-sensing transcriptional regulator
VEWKSKAACDGHTGLFFAAFAERPDVRVHRERQARELCEQCPVLEACRAWARERREYGFWGGESEEERAAAGYPVALPVGRVARVIRDRNLRIRSDLLRTRVEPSDRYSRTG